MTEPFEFTTGALRVVHDRSQRIVRLIAGPKECRISHNAVPLDSLVAVLRELGAVQV